MNLLHPVLTSTVLAVGAWLSIAGTTREGTHSPHGPHGTAGDSPRSVSVDGRGEVRAAPDVAHVTVGVEAQADSASQALQANSQAMDQLMKKLGQHEIAKEDVQTTRFTVTPRRREDPSPEMVGYDVANHVRITVRRVEELGKVLDGVVSAGANRIHGIRFGVSTRDELLDQARRLAVEDAERKAGILAEAAGAALGPPLEISESSSGGPRPAFRAQMETSGSVPIARGEETLATRVSVTFELKVSSSASGSSAGAGRGASGIR